MITITCPHCGIAKSLPPVFSDQRDFCGIVWPCDCGGLFVVKIIEGVPVAIRRDKAKIIPPLVAL